MSTLATLLSNWTEPGECTTVVHFHFPDEGPTPSIWFHRTIPLPPFETLTARILFFQDCLQEMISLSGMLRTLLRVTPSIPFVPPTWEQDGRFSVSHVPMFVLDVGASRYPTHALFTFSPDDPSRMSMYVVHSIILQMFCPALHASLPFSPTSSAIYTPTTLPRLIMVPAYPICIAYPEALGIFLPYFYVRDTRSLVCQCLPLLDWTSQDHDIFVDLDDPAFLVSLGYYLALTVPYQTIVESTVKTYTLSISAWQLTVLDTKLWRVLHGCYEILLNALAYTTAGCSLKRLDQEIETS
ncbi:hypothetical protein GGU10DRAFT_135183 [Lentinula aff. detonsa]|uniref:Uncharacterized protein n=1 Tax=Lentinula aff. detonsa TaxID=2804958 RepID=A0AA38KXK6_9AGAR|nr:hypothetical protein GGU10DRAFT_135183 [Lentinula aff. detonsa]